ncbi:hypothetical protein LTR15_011566 [Elasticomyces elasticus]|nr:hypothetical protein LTR15_011566 [Elasticomyces elasticus]
MDPNVFIDPEDFELLIATGGKTKNLRRSQPGPQSMTISTLNPALAALNIGGPQSGQQGWPASTANRTPVHSATSFVMSRDTPQRQPWTAPQHPRGYPVQQYLPVAQHPQQSVNPQQQAVHQGQYVQQPTQQPTTGQYPAQPYQPQDHQPQQSQQFQQPMGQYQPYTNQQPAQQPQIAGSQPQLLPGPGDQSVPTFGPAYASGNAPPAHLVQGASSQQGPNQPFGSGAVAPWRASLPPRYFTVSLWRAHPVKFILPNMSAQDIVDNNCYSQQGKLFTWSTALGWVQQGPDRTLQSMVDEAGGEQNVLMVLEG